MKDVKGTTIKQNDILVTTDEYRPTRYKVSRLGVTENSDIVLSLIGSDGTVYPSTARYLSAFWAGLCYTVEE